MNAINSLINQGYVTRLGNNFYGVNKEFTAYKSVYPCDKKGLLDHSGLFTVIELTIPAGAVARLAHGNWPDERKCRANKAISHGSGLSRHDRTFKYREGKKLKPENQFSFINYDCAAGIHFFLSYEDALNY